MYYYLRIPQSDTHSAVEITLDDFDSFVENDDDGRYVQESNVVLDGKGVSEEEYYSTYVDDYQPDLEEWVAD